MYNDVSLQIVKILMNLKYREYCFSGESMNLRRLIFNNQLFGYCKTQI